MNDNVKRTRLKGGSLSGTYLVEPPGQAPFVRKDASLTKNREYGFQRWYSQLKRLQRYGEMFPGVFPKLLDYGMESDDVAYFDIEYIPDAVTIQAWLLEHEDPAEVATLLERFMAVADRMHHTRIASTPAPMALYIHEEIEVKVEACLKNARFTDFLKHKEIVFNGRAVRPLVANLEAFKALAKQSYKNATENFTHGNLTLENVLYVPSTGRVVFIDPYEENIIDSALAEYSQVFQSSNAKYELYNAGTAVITGNQVSMKIPEAPGLARFNDQFTALLKTRLSDADLLVVRLLEVSQFARMLPFKMEIDEDKMLFFYALASALFHDLQEAAA